MTPSFVMNDIPDSRTMNSILGCNGNLRYASLRIPSPDSENISLGKLCRVVRVTVALPFLFATIRNVFKLCTKSQMGDTNAARVVASMHDDHSFGDGAMRQFPSDTMGAGSFSVNSHDAITAMLDSARPEPATWGFVDFGPKTLTDWRTVMAVDVLNWLIFNPTKTLGTIRGNRRALTATAMAITVWGIVRGIIEGHP